MKDLGTKFSCYKCQAKFYDLKKPAPICPKCGADQREMPPPSKSERKKAAAVVATRLEAVEDFDGELPKEKDEEEDEDEEDVEADEPA